MPAGTPAGAAGQGVCEKEKAPKPARHRGGAITFRENSNFSKGAGNSPEQGQNDGPFVAPPIQRFALANAKR
jgi:hypothetical protein